MVTWKPETVVDSDPLAPPVVVTTTLKVITLAESPTSTVTLPSDATVTPVVAVSIANEMPHAESWPEAIKEPSAIMSVGVLAEPGATMFKLNSLFDVGVTVQVGYVYAETASSELIAIMVSAPSASNNTE
jgi:hypothetical protein